MSIVIGGITLDNNMSWEDQFKWSPVTTKAEYSITGDLVVQSWKRRTYRPLTLKGDANHGWQKKSTVESLYALASGANDDLGPVVHTVNFHGTQYQVVFDAGEGAPVEFEPVTWETEPDSEFWYTGTIRMRILA